MRSNITYYLDDTAKEHGSKAAFVDHKKTVTFNMLRTGALRIAEQLVKKEIFKRPVVVYLEKGADVLTCFMGAAYSVNFYSPIDVEMPAARVNKILSVLDPAIVITTKELKSGFEEFEYSGEYLLIDDGIYEESGFEKIDTDLIFDQRSNGIDTDLLYVLFTSGSTGVPKGVTINHRAVIDYMDWVTGTFDITYEDSFGNQAPFYFDNSILDIYSTIKTGATCYIIPRELFSQPVPLLEYIKENRINTIFWVPSALIVVAKLKAFRNVDLTGTLKRVLFCGEVMPNKQLNIWRSFLPDVLYANLYGPTEITDACTYYIVDREFADEEPLPIGIEMANTDILILNDKDELVTKPEEVGELCVRGTSLSMGYYNNPEKTRDAFVQNPLNPYVPETIYRTGDLVKYNERHEIIYLSRKDFQIKHMGHRIELGEIETAVSSLEEVTLCCCLYDEARQKIVLFLDVDLDKAYINERISKLVPEYMFPNKVIFMETMPINANGKIDRVKLKEYL
ncbi:MAG: amino acid adenylation domain-containing protein [Lachnospiraceae bacterium]|nr:amino acid adenylation domain-containing protein [Lachnospiraceae bacterium]